MELFTILWLALLIAFLVVEASTVTLISLWFAAGALAALIASLLHAPLWLQAVLFFAVSAALLACLRPVYLKKMKIGKNPFCIFTKKQKMKYTVSKYGKFKLKIIELIQN